MQPAIVELIAGMIRSGEKVQVISDSIHNLKVPVLPIKQAVFPLWSSCIKYANNVCFLLCCDKVWDAILPHQLCMRDK